MINSSNPLEAKTLLDHSDCFADKPKFSVSGTLKKNFDSLILSDFWPEEVPASMVVNTDKQAILRAR